MAPVALALALTLAASPVPPDIAALFPPDALAYAEVRDPAKLADAVAAFAKDTPLADSLAFSHDRRDRLAGPGVLPQFRAVQSLGLFTSPEMLAELKRTGGVAAALLGFDPKTGTPRYAVAVRLGDSHALGLLVRAYLTTGTAVRRVGKVGDVPVYQNCAITGGRFEGDVPVPADERLKKPAGPNVPPEHPTDATYAYLPGLFVIGSGKAAVADVLDRVRTPKAESLAATLAKVEARTKPGVFVWADPARLDKGYAAARKISDDPLIPEGVVAHLRLLLHPKSLSPLAGTFSIEPDGFTFTASAEVGEPGPLPALLSGGLADAAALRAEGTAWGGFTVGLPKEGRAKAVGRVADALSAATGSVGLAPGERLAELTKGGFKAEADLFPQLKGVTVFPPDDRGQPLAVLTLESVDAAKAWEAAVPQLVQWLVGGEKPPQPASEVVSGLTVYGVVFDVPGGRVSTFYCRNGDQLAVGGDRGRVAAASALDPVAKPPVKLDKGGTPAAVGFVRWNAVAAWAASVLADPNAEFPSWRGRSGGKAELLVKPGGEPLLVDPGSEQEVKPGSEKADAKKDEKADTPAGRLAKAVGEVPAITLEAGVSGKTLTVAARFRCDKLPLAAFLSAWMAWAESPNKPQDQPPVPDGDIPLEVNPLKNPPGSG